MKRKARFITIVSNKPQTISPLESRLLRTEGEKIRSGIASPLLGVEDPLLGPAFAMAASPPPAPPPDLGVTDPATRTMDPPAQALEQPRPAPSAPPCEEERGRRRGRSGREARRRHHHPVPTQASGWRRRSHGQAASSSPTWLGRGDARRPASSRAATPPDERRVPPPPSWVACSAGGAAGEGREGEGARRLGLVARHCLRRPTDSATRGGDGEGGAPRPGAGCCTGENHTTVAPGHHPQRRKVGAAAWVDGHGGGGRLGAMSLGTFFCVCVYRPCQSVPVRGTTFT